MICDQTEGWKTRNILDYVAMIRTGSNEGDCSSSDSFSPAYSSTYRSKESEGDSAFVVEQQGYDDYINIQRASASAAMSPTSDVSPCHLEPSEDVMYMRSQNPPPSQTNIISRSNGVCIGNRNQNSYSSPPRNGEDYFNQREKYQATTTMNEKPLSASSSWSPKNNCRNINSIIDHRLTSLSLPTDRQILRRPTSHQQLPYRCNDLCLDVVTAVSSNESSPECCSSPSKHAKSPFEYALHNIVCIKDEQSSSEINMNGACHSITRYLHQNTVPEPKKQQEYPYQQERDISDQPDAIIGRNYLQNSAPESKIQPTKIIRPVAIRPQFVDDDRQQHHLHDNSSIERGDDESFLLMPQYPRRLCRQLDNINNREAHYQKQQLKLIAIRNLKKRERLQQHQKQRQDEISPLQLGPSAIQERQSQLQKQHKHQISEKGTTFVTSDRNVPGAIIMNKPLTFDNHHRQQEISPLELSPDPTQDDQQQSLQLRLPEVQQKPIHVHGCKTVTYDATEEKDIEFSRENLQACGSQENQFKVEETYSRESSDEKNLKPPSPTTPGHVDDDVDDETLKRNLLKSNFVTEAKTKLLHTLAVEGGNVKAKAYLRSLEPLQESYLNTNFDARYSSDEHETSNINRGIEGMWLTLSKPTYNGCLGDNIDGDPMYTLGRMTFDMFLPTKLVCSIQGIFNSVEKVDIPKYHSHYDYRSDDHHDPCPRHVKKQQIHSCSSSVDIDTVLEQVYIEKMKHKVPASLHEEVFSSTLNNTISTDGTSACSTLRTYNLITAFTIEEYSPDIDGSGGGNRHPNYNIHQPIRGIMTMYGYCLPDPCVRNRLSVWFTGSKIEPNSNKKDIYNWKKVFFPSDRNKSHFQRTIVEKMELFAVKTLMGGVEFHNDNTINTNMTNKLSNDGGDVESNVNPNSASITYEFKRPLGGHGKAFTDVLYLDNSLRVARGQKGTDYVFARVHDYYSNHHNIHPPT